jgi:ubiquitin C-terminal hydrolase
MDLSLDLRLKNKKGQLGQGAIIQSLQQCLARFTATEKLDREYNCGKCEAARDATKQLTVKRLPPVLCIQLKVCGLKVGELVKDLPKTCRRLDKVREYCKFNT